VTLDDLVGTHTISAIWRGHMKDPNHLYESEAMVVLLKIDDVVYRFQEDPDDGWRSQMREVRVATAADLAAMGGLSMLSSFPPVVVELRKRPGDQWSSNDVLYAIDERTNLVILETRHEQHQRLLPELCFFMDARGLRARLVRPTRRHMLTNGKKYFFKTFSHHYLGELVATHATHFEIKHASEVYETGPLDEFYGKGIVKAAERVPDGWLVPIAGTAIGPWTHALPKKAVGI
jgi:hypothetical protein